MLEAWGLPEPETVHRPPRGTNNIVRIVQTAGRWYVLRTYQNLTAQRVDAEHALLAALARRQLPFAVPTPVVATTGDTWIESAAGVVALYDHVPGSTGRLGNLADIELAGEALAMLDLALAHLPAELAPVDWSSLPLSGIHPAVPDVAELAVELARLLHGHPGVGWLADHAEPADELHSRLAQELPTQVVHGDFALGNLLVDDGRVVGVLDFEIAGLDLRVADYVAGLCQCTTFGTAEPAAFRRGFQRRHSLSEAEWDAVPGLVRLRALGSVVWRAGRWRRGQAGLDEVRDRLDAGLAVEGSMHQWLV